MFHPAQQHMRGNTMIQLHETAMGQRLILRDIPALVDQLILLNRNLEALTSRLHSLPSEQKPNTEAEVPSGEMK
jgi:hypothetical protein